jgi:hypothetical protein
MNDVIISITPRDPMGVMIVPRMLPHKISPADVPTKQREPLKQRSGSFDYRTGALEGGTLEVCIQSYTATTDSPSRVAFTVATPSNVHEIEQALQSERTELYERMNVATKLVNAETSRITTELVRMHRRAKALADDGQYSKQNEEEFHNESIKLNRAVQYWPMLRIAILLLGGYMQVTHVVAYMKSRHIY